ncbi:MAG: hypothetical protein RIS92_2058, partial [Verrucomicrobiota bacterium]
MIFGEARAYVVAWLGGWGVGGVRGWGVAGVAGRSEEHTSELQSP